jgi:hypothetical protein
VAAAFLSQVALLDKPLIQALERLLVPRRSKGHQSLKTQKLNGHLLFFRS